MVACACFAHIVSNLDVRSSRSAEHTAHHSSRLLKSRLANISTCSAHRCSHSCCFTVDASSSIAYGAITAAAAAAASTASAAFTAVAAASAAFAVTVTIAIASTVTAATAAA